MVQNHLIFLIIFLFTINYYRADCFQMDLFSPLFQQYSTFHSFQPKLWEPQFETMGFKIRQDVQQSLKPMKIQQDKDKMIRGTGGVTLINMPGKTLIAKDGTILECLGNVVPYKPFCLGQLRKFHIRSRKDYCFSVRYSQMGNVFCIGHNDQTGLSFNQNNGKFSCMGSDERPVLVLNSHDYQNLCGKLPWQNSYNYYPDLDNPLHVNLPNPDLHCQLNNAKLCSFHVNPNNDSF